VICEVDFLLRGDEILPYCACANKFLGRAFSSDGLAFLGEFDAEIDVSGCEDK
jgi:hypothetical protein